MMQLCAINKCVTTVLNKLRKKSWTENDRETSLFAVSLLEDWLKEARNYFETKEITENDLGRVE